MTGRFAARLTRPEALTAILAGKAHSPRSRPASPADREAPRGRERRRATLLVREDDTFPAKSLRASVLVAISTPLRASSATPFHAMGSPDAQPESAHFA